MESNVKISFGNIFKPLFSLWKFRVLLAVIFITFIVYCAENQKVILKSSGEITKADWEFLDSLQYRTFLYFWNEVNFENGLVKDRSTMDSPASIAATGFALPVWAIGIEKGWISREEASLLTLKLLEFLINSEQSKSADATGYKGLFYHFIDMNTGKRFWNCELSSVDTAWLIAGIRFASIYFTGDNKVENKIRELSDTLTFRIDWDWMTIPASVRSTGGSVSMDWKPEKGLSNAGWTGYNEALYLYVLAAGSGYRGYKKAYEAWINNYNWCGISPDLEHAYFPPMFGHQYSHMFIDFRNIFDDYMMEKGIDYFENSRRAAYTQYNYSINNPMTWKGYDSLTWGLTACDGPLEELKKLDRDIYRAYSARGQNLYCEEFFDDGTIAPTAAAASIVFAPEIVIPALKNIKNQYGDLGLWGEYGFKDAFNPAVQWIGKEYIGIDQAPIVIMIENLRNGFVWEYCKKDTVLQKGLRNLGFRDKK